MKQYVGVIVTVVLFLIGYFVAFGRIQAQTESIKEAVEKNETKTEEVEDKVVENEQVDVEQTVTLKYIQQTLEILNKKIDKELAQ